MAPSPKYDPVEHGALCHECPLNGRTVVPPSGAEDPELVIVGEGPGEQEVRQGRPFVGPSGKKLDELLREAGGIRRSQVWISNALLCLAPTSKVVLPDRSTKTIREIVATRYAGPVLSVDDSGRLVPRQVVGWHRSIRGGRKLFKLSSKHAKGNCKGNVGPVLTEDHLVMTRRGWVRVCDITGNDLVATGHSAYAPGGSGYDVVLGSMLGDGMIPRSKVGRAHNFSISHEMPALDWLYAKSRALAALDPQIKVNVFSGGSPNPQARMLTAATPWLSEIAEKWYGAAPKRFVPRDLELTPRMLAVWFLDNGYMRFNESKAVKGIARSKPRPRAEFATNRFDRADVEFLVEVLSRFGIAATVRFGHGWRIDVGVDHAGRISEIIAPFTPPCMQYKLLPIHRGLYNPVLYDTEPATTYWDLPVVAEFSHRTKTVFCIDVEDTHNFVTTNGVVHNCRAEVPDLKTKARFEVKNYIAWLQAENKRRRKEAKEIGGVLRLLKSPFTCCKPRLRRELKRAELVAVARGQPNGAIIVPLGNFAMKVVTGLVGVMKYRGSPLNTDHLENDE